MFPTPSIHEDLIRRSQVSAVVSLNLVASQRTFCNFTRLVISEPETPCTTSPKVVLDSPSSSQSTFEAASFTTDLMGSNASISFTSQRQKPNSVTHFRIYQTEKINMTRIFYDKEFNELKMPVTEQKDQANNVD